MPQFGPISRRNLITALRELGFSGPYAGGKHEYMDNGDRTVILPNPHQGDIGRALLARILKQAGITKDEWEAV